MSIAAAASLWLPSALSMRSVSVRPDPRIAVVISAPTNADMQRGRYTSAFRQLKSSASPVVHQPNSSSASNGALDRHLGSFCVRKYSIDVFPVMITVSMASALSPACSASSVSRHDTASRTIAASLSAFPSREASIRLMTSAPNTDCGFHAPIVPTALPSR